MGYRLAADGVLLAHLGFLLFVALGGFLAWRHRWVAVPHALAVGWGLLSVAAGVGCPLTLWEDRFRRAAGDEGLAGGFVDTYLTGVIYPAEHLLTAQLLVAGLVAVSWIGVAGRRSGSSPHRTTTRPGGGITGRRASAPPPRSPGDLR